MTRNSLLILVLSLVAPICSAQSTTAPATHPVAEVVGHIDSPAIPESSGVVASHRYPGVFWTHNDSGDPPDLFAITREGKLISQFAVAATNIDWEDIAFDDQGRLYLADIGNNARNRKQIEVYRLSEPNPRAAATNRALLVPEQTWKLLYPGAPFDAESLFILDDHGYIIAKNLDGAPADLYRFSIRETEPQVLERILTLPTRAPVTAADVSPDHRLLAIMTLLGPIVYRIDGDLTRIPTGQVWSDIFIDPHIEGVCFTDEGLLATTEGRRVVFFHLPQRAATTAPAEPPHR